MKVLLVEDVDESRVVLRAMLEKLGHKVVEAGNGHQAVKTALDQNPDVVLMDLSMPEVDGLQATGALRAIAHFSHFSQLPIIAITAYPETLSRDKALKAGCDRYLRKPVDLADLAQVLNSLKGSA
jgi:two-component system sensor histidine kinase TorS